MRTLLLGLALAALAPAAAAQTIGDLTVREGEIPVRLVGYGLVVGLDGSGDRSFGTSVGSVHTVRSVTNLLRRFNIEVPPERLRLRNVAAVLVTAELSPYLRPGGRFEVQVASLGDATSLRGGVLWMTPLMAGPDDPPVATAQGPLPVTLDMPAGFRARAGASGRIVDGGILEASLGAMPVQTANRLLLKSPDLAVAARLVEVIEGVAGSGSARIEDPGSIALSPPAGAADNLPGWMAGLDTLPVRVPAAARIVIDARNGSVVAGGHVPVGEAVVSLAAVTVRISARREETDAIPPGVLALASGVTVQDVAEGLRALGVGGADLVAVFDGLRVAGALTAAVIVR